jgi:hypothetical protein
MFRRVSTLAALTAAAALVPATAGAAGTSHVIVDTIVEQGGGTVDCSEFGPYGFNVDYSGTERVQISEVRAKDGTVLQTIVHGTVHEIDRNSVTGMALPLKQAFTQVFDWPSNTRTLTGVVYMGTQPGSGTWVHDTGRITLDLDTSDVVSIAGRHEAYYGNIDKISCDALATPGRVPPGKK